MDTRAVEYLMGHNDPERRRLALQASILNPLSEQFYKRAGISAGMTVLDLGCGVGDVSLLVGRLVGPTGSVVGIDIDQAALSECRSRAQQAGFTHLTFQHCAIDDFQPDRPVDAVVGRCILVHLRDRLSVLKKLHSILKPAGIAAFYEPDFSMTRCPFPTTPLAEQFWEMVNAVCRAMKPDFAVTMHSLLTSAGFSTPQIVVEITVDHGPHSAFYDWLAQTWVSLQPAVQKLGLKFPPQTDAPSLVVRLREEFAASNLPIFGAVMVGGIAKKPT